jgi:hypothetical protein
MERELITKDDSRRINSMNILSSSSNKDTRQQEIVTSDIYEFQDNPDPGVYLPPHRSHHLKTAQTESVHVNRFSPSEGYLPAAILIHIFITDAVSFRGPLFFIFYPDWTSTD